MKRLLSVILALCLVFSLVACAKPADKNPTKPTADTKPATKPTTSTQMSNNCKLIVNGKNLTAQNYVHLNEEYRYVELPLTAVMKALGAKVEWRDKTTVIISTGSNHSHILDTTESHFGLLLPPGSRSAVRKVIDNEIVVDSTSANVLIRTMGAEIKINYDEKIVEIETSAPTTKPTAEPTLGCSTKPTEKECKL